MNKKLKEIREHTKIDQETENKIRNRKSWEPSEGRIRQMGQERKTQISRRLGWPSRGF